MDLELRRTVERVLTAAQDLSLATLRSDGWPQATVVSFVPDGLRPCFVIGANSQKARNIAADDRVSFTATPPYERWDAIRGLSAAGRAERLEGADARRRVAALMARRFADMSGALPEGWELQPDLVFVRVRPTVISVLDYTQGFGHTDLVAEITEADLEATGPDVVEEADLESFPASDAPSWIGMHVR